MATATHPNTAVKTPATDHRGTPALNLATVVDRTTELSEHTIQVLEDGARAAIEAVGRFAITVEEALPQEVEGSTDVAKKITESGLQMVDRLGQTQAEFLRKVVESAGKSLSSGDGAKPKAAK